MGQSLLPSLIRTLVPLIVGHLLSIAFFADANVAGLTELVTLLVSGIYYLAVRVLEYYASKRFGWLLGWPNQPKYEVKGKA